MKPAEKTNVSYHIGEGVSLYSDYSENYSFYISSIFHNIEQMNKRIAVLDGILNNYNRLKKTFVVRVLRKLWKK